MIRFVLYSETDGVFMGVMYGDKPVWAKLKRDLGQYLARTFESTAEATAMISEMTTRGRDTHACRVVEVQADGAGNATLAACIAAGLPEVPEDRPPPLPPEPEANPDWLANAQVLDGGRA